MTWFGRIGRGHVLQIRTRYGTVCIGHRRVGSRSAGLNDPPPLLVIEEEGLSAATVLNTCGINSGPPRLAPKMFCLNFGTGRVIGGTCLLILVEVVVRIQVVVAEEFPTSAMEFLRAALQSETERRSGSNTVIRRIVAGQYLKLGNGVHRRHDAHSAGAAAVIRFRTIQKPDVMALAQAVHADACARSRSCWRVVVRQVGADAQAESRQVP